MINIHARGFGMQFEENYKILGAKAAYEATNAVGAAVHIIQEDVEGATFDVYVDWSKFGEYADLETAIRHAEAKVAFRVKWEN